MKNLSLFVLAAALVCSCAQQPAGSSEQGSGEVSAIDAIMARRSIRAYKAEPVARETMDKILECGINAPSGSNRQQWAVRVIDNQSVLEGITAIWAENNPGAQRETSNPAFRNMFRSAPTVAFIAAPDSSVLLDCGMLAQNMMISAQALGVGTCCLGGCIPFLNSEAAAAFVKTLDLPEGYSLVLALALGYPDESPEAKPRDASKARYIE